MDISGKKVIKPFYNVRLANRMQATAKELHEQAEGFAKDQESKTLNLMENMVGSTFHKVKTKAVLRREANLAKKRLFQEALVSMIATAAYKAMPVDGKEPLVEESSSISDQPKAFQQLIETVTDLVTSDPTVSMLVGDKYARASTIDLGSTTSIKASQMAVAICASVQPVAEKLSDNPDPASYTAQNFIDTMLTYGDQSDRQMDSNLVESMYETFVQKLAEDVEGKVIAALKVDAERAEMAEFLQESYKEDKYSAVSNRNLSRVVGTPSVFREVFKTIHAKAGIEGYPKDMILAEAVAQYTLMETLNAIELLGKNEKQIIDECITKRREIMKK